MATLIGTGVIEVVPRLIPSFGPQLQAQMVGGTKTAGAAATKEAEAAGAAAGQRYAGGMRGAMSSMAGPIAATLAVVAGVGTVLFKVGDEFDKAYDNIRVRTGATGAVFDGLKQSLKNVAVQSSASIGDIGTAMADLNARTGQTGPGLELLTRQMLTLSSRMGGDLRDNIRQTTRMFGDWGISTKDQGGSLDYLYKMAQHTGTGIADLQEKVVFFGAPMRQFGFSFQDATALLAKWEKEGVNTTTVLAGMRMGLGNLTSETKRASISKNLGIQISADPKIALQQIEGAIKNAGTAAQANQMAFQVFGKRAGPDMAAAIREGRFNITDLEKVVNSSGETILGTSAKVRSFSQSWAMAKNALKVTVEPLAMAAFNGVSAALEGIRTKLLPFAKELTEKLKPAGEAIAKLFKDLAPVLAVAAKVVGGVLIVAFMALNVAVIGLSKMLTLLLTAAKTVGSALASFGKMVAETVGPPIQRAMATIWGAIQTGLSAIKSAWDTVWKALSTVIGPVWNVIRTIVVGGISAISSAVSAGMAVVHTVWNAVWGALSTLIGPIWNGIRTVIGGAISAISSVISAGMNAIRAVWNGIWSRVSADVAIVWNAIRPIIQTGISIISSAISTGMAVVRAVWNAAWTAISAIVKVVWAVIGPIVRVGISAISAVISASMAVVRTVWNAAWTAISAVVRAVWVVIGPIVRVGIAAISAVVSAGMVVVRTVWNAAWTVIRTVLSGIWTAIKAVVKVGMDWIFSPISTGMSAIKAVFSTVWNAISAAFRAVWTVLRTVATTTINAISAVVSVVWNAVRAVFTAVWNAIRAAFTAVWNAMRASVTAVINAISTTISAVWNAERAFFAAVWNAIRAAFTAVWNAMRASVTAIINAISATITAVWSAVRGTFIAIWNAISGFFTAIWNALRNTATTMVNAISGTITAVWNAVKNTFSSVWNAISGFFTTIWNALRNTATTMVNAISATITTVWNAVKNTFSSVWNAISSFFTGIWNGLKAAAGAAIDWISNKISTVMDAVSSAWKAVWQGIKDVFNTIWSGIKEVFRVPINFVIRGINTFGGIINTVTDFAGLGKPIPHVSEIGAKKGVRLPGYGGGDVVPAMLEPGEAVVPKHLVAEMAPWAAKHRIPGFANGGLVGVPLKDTKGQPVNQGGPWDWIKDAAGTVASGISGVASDIASAIADAAKWVYEKGTKLFRIGAADALSGLLKGPEAALALATKPFGKPGEMLDKGAVKIVDDMVAWVRGKEGPDPSAGGGGDVGGVADSNAVVAFAKTLVGCPYAPPYYSPAGFSCDGLVWYVFKHFGIDLPRGATNQMNAVQRLPGQASAQPGDVAGFHQDGPSGGNPLGLEFHHIGLVTGANQMIAAQNPGTGVVVTSISGNDSGPGHYDRFGRVLQNLNPGWGTPAYIAAHSGGGKPGAGGHYSQGQMEAALRAAGFDPGTAHIFSAIGMGETSGWDFPTTNPTGRYHGPWAFQEAWAIPAGINMGLLDTSLAYAARQVKILYDRAGWGPWAGDSPATGPGNYSRFMADGGLVQSYDRGGFLPPGLSVAYNGTGKPEPVGHASTVQNNSVTLTLNVANGEPVAMRAAAQQVVDDALTALARRLSSGAGRN